jgi:high-affinity nickel permease
MSGGQGRLQRMSAELSGREWWHVAAMFGFILALNAAGWAIYLLVVMPHHFDYRGEGGSPAPSSAYETAGGTAGTLVSAGFLYLIALLNLIVLAGIFKVFREMRSGAYDEAGLEAQLQAGGLMYRFFGWFMRSIRHPWQLYFVGLVFGIGFDATTEVVLLAATAYAAIQRNSIPTG